MEGEKNTDECVFCDMMYLFIYSYFAAIDVFFKYFFCFFFTFAYPMTHDGQSKMLLLSKLTYLELSADLSQVFSKFAQHFFSVSLVNGFK